MLDINSPVKEFPIRGLTGMMGGVGLGFGNPGPSGFVVEQALRFHSPNETNLSRTPGSQGSRTTWTYSFWFKPGTRTRYAGSSGAGSVTFLSVNPSETNTTYAELLIESDRMTFQGATITWVMPNQRFRDAAGWYHIVLICDTTNGTAADRVRLYSNGERITSFQTNQLAGDSVDLGINNTVLHTIGIRAGTTQNPLDGYLADVHFIDGTAVGDTNGTIDEFGEFNTDGVWVPKEYSGGHGTQGYYLTFDSTAANGIGHDHSANSNNWTANNFIAADQDINDTPNTNFPTFNPLVRNGGTYSDANMEYVAPTSDSVTPTTFSFNTSNSPSWYVEFTHNLQNRSALGVANAQATNYSSADPRFITTPCVVYDSNGPIWIDSTEQSPSQSAWNAGSTISMRFDASTRGIIFANNGTDQTGVTTTLPADTDMTIICGDMTGVGGGSVFNINTGQDTFAETMPAGFVAPKATNLGAASSIRDGSQHCGVVTYTGPISHTTTTTGETSNITGLNFTPGLVWVKNRTNANWHVLVDSLRVQSDGDDFIASNDSAIQQSNLNGSVSALNSGGFTVITGSDSSSKANLTCSDNFDYVAWCWKAGTAFTPTVTGGFSSPSATINVDAGFGIYKVTGSNAQGSFTTGLNSEADFIVCKRLSSGTADWGVYHRSYSGAAPSAKLLHLNNSSNPADKGSNIWVQTGTTIEVDSFAETGSTGDYIYYVWTSIPGYSKFGSFTGDDQTDGPFIYTGFRPRIILMKSASNGFDWFIWDTERDKFNPSENTLEPNTSNTEADASNPVQSIDIFSNGFKILSGNQVNQPSATIVYAAWGDNPVGGTGMAPVTAR